MKQFGQQAKQNQNQMETPKFTQKGSLQSFLNQLENAVVLGNLMEEYKTGQ